MILLCVAGVGGCFESGPLAAADVPDATGQGDGDIPDGGDGQTSTAAPDATLADPDSATDSGVATDTRDATGIADATDTADAIEIVDATDTVAPDTGDTRDTGDTGDASDTGDAVEVEARACVGDDDCAGVPATDRCAGPIRCLDYQCRPDPAGRVVCPEPDACSRWACAPASGECVETNTCACDGDALACGIDAIWSTPVGGSGPALPAYTCGPAATGGTVRLFEMAVHGRVRVSASGGVRGLHVLPGDVCDGQTCAAGGDDALYFDATPGARYTLAVEESGPNTQHAVRADCDLIDEVVCNDGLDDDGDGLTDCAERACDGIAGCDLPPASEVDLCGDHLDNDTDGATDCDDVDCADDAGCLESCEILAGSIYCNYHQGFDNGAGKAHATHYACTATPQTAREVVFRIDAGFTGRIRIGFSGSNGLALFLMRETGRGCTPHDCIEMSTGDMFIDLVEGDTFYLAIDGPGDAVGDFDFMIDCLE